MPITRTLTPGKPGRVKFATSPAPSPLTQNWFQIRHHQDKRRANEHHHPINELAASGNETKNGNDQCKSDLDGRERAKLPRSKSNVA